MGLFRRYKAFLADKRGNVLIMTAAAMPLLIGSAGLAVDTIQLSLLKRHLQRAADSGALAGAYAKVQAKSVDDAVTKALGFNDAFPLASTPVITQPTTGLHAGRSVLVQLSGKRSLPFWSFFGAPPTVTVKATAALVYSGKYCMVALDESSATGITFSGSSIVNLGCGVISNTSGSQSVLANGSATVTASPIAGVGGVPSSSAYVQPTLLLPNSLKQEDPFAGLPQPSPPSCSNAIQVNPHDTQNIGPGCYSGMRVQGTLNLSPGTYYISGGAFDINAGAKLAGEGVTLIFTSPTPSDQNSYPSISINGSAELKLTAPDYGTYEGILMQYDARKTSGSYYINGNSNSKFEGAFYFPKQNLTFNGNSDMETNCIQMVAYHVTFTGNVEINNSCPTSGGAKSFDAKWVRLVA